ncbi:MAG: rhomboid family intramembrane serine protease [Bacteroidota bacterium]
MRKFPLSELLSIIKYPLLFLIICWAVFLCDLSFDLDLYSLGVSPRTLSGLKGILFSPFIHGDFGHIINNSLPVFILSSMIFYFYRPIAWPAILWIYFVSGIWLWIGGRNNDVIVNYHFGASTLIYGFATFLFFSGVFRKHKQLMMVSAFVVFMYGSITHGIFPFDTRVSWEGHLFGALSGLLVAFSYRKDGPQQVKHEWPDEERDLEAEYNRQLELERMIEEQNNKPSLDPFQIIYHFKPNEEESESPEEKKP